MRTNTRSLLVFLIVFVLIAPIARPASAGQQPNQPFEPLINRLREGLKLNDAQADDLRKLLIKHAPKLMELRNRAQTNPYAPGLQPEVDKEQKAIREEFSEVLDEDQKGKLASVDLRQLVPLGPPFVVINILPRI